MGNKKRFVGLLLIIIGVVVGLFFLFNRGGGVVDTGLFSGSGTFLFATTPISGGCDLVQNLDDPQSAYTEVIQGGPTGLNYVCDSDECIVQGVMTVTKDSGGGTQNIICQDVDPCKQSTQNVCWCWTLNKCVFGDGGDVCDTRSSSSYDASFNFCPSSDSNNAFCSGSENDVSSGSSGVTHYTDEVKLFRGQSLSFTPTHPDGSAVEDISLRVKLGDCSCQAGLVDGSTCDPDSGRVWCSGVPTCPSGFTLQTSGTWACDTSPGGIPSGWVAVTDNSVSGSELPVCRASQFDGDATNSAADCAEPQGSTDNVYNKCDGSTVIDQVTCDAFTNAEFTCPTGQVCVVDETGQTGVGLGGCQCPSDTCSSGQTRNIDGDRYEVCELVGSCNDWVTKTCPVGLKFNSDVGGCVCDPALSCEPNSAQCTSTDSIRSCEAVSISGRTCYQWQAVETCEGEETCNTRGTSGADDACDCSSVDVCQFGDLRCIDSSTYQTCGKDESSPADSCLLFRGSVDVDFGFKCENDAIVARDDIGCSFGTPGPEYDPDEANFETCINNQIVCVQDANTASEADFLNIADGGNTRCDGNTVQTVARFEGAHITCYRWQNQETCGGNFICQKASPAVCVPNFENVGIISPDKFGIDQNIEVAIVVTKNVGDNSNIPIDTRIFEGSTSSTPLVIRKTVTNSKGNVTVDFNYAHPRAGDLIVVVTAGDSNLGDTFTAEKSISVESTLDLRLNCPTQGFIGRDIECSWTVENAETGLRVDANPKITVLQGETSITETPIGTTGLKFKTDTVGSVFVQVVVEKEGFISDTEELTVSVQPLQQTQTLNIDNRDFFTFTESGITTGTHQLEIVVEESGVPIEVFSVEGEIRTPSGAKEPVTFTKTSTGRYKTTYNFQQAGQTYDLSGTVVFEEQDKSPVPFSYKIVTLGSATEAQRSNTNLAIIVGSVIVLVVIGVGILIARRVK